MDDVDAALEVHWVHFVHRRSRKENKAVALRETVAGPVVVTGASTGIGAACALHLAALGFRVFAGIRKREDGEALRARAPERLTPLILDVTDADSIAAAAGVLRDETGEIGLVGLVNNAGIVVPGPLEFLPIDKLRRQLEVNLIGQVAVTQAMLPLLRKAKGRIVNMGSISGLLAAPFTGPYAMSKFALEAYSDALRMELAPWGIRVSLIEPGSIKTPIWNKSKESGENIYDDLDEDGRRLYEKQLFVLREQSVKVGSHGLPPEAVARTVAHALTARRPRTRYTIGLDSKALRVMARWLPDRLRDAIILRGMGFSKLEPPSS